MKNHSILLVDDQPDNLKIMINYLKESGVDYQILLAPNGKIALEIADKKNPDLIVTDWDMPVMDGIELIKQLKKREKTKDIPVIVASGVMTLPGNVKTALETGAIDYIKKPVDKVELAARVNSMLKLSISYKKIKEQNQQLEKQKKEIQNFAIELETLNKTKDKFFSIIAHDLKSPFQAILGFSELLTVSYNNFDDKKRKEFIKLIYESSKNTFKLLENLFTWARSQSGEIQFFPEKLNLKEIVSDAVEENKGTANKKGIQLLNNIKDNEYIVADKNMIAVALRNLISNSIKFTGHKGEVVIESKQNEDNDFTEISISDTGVGISQKQIKDLFSINKNVSTPGTENEKGTGLGLTLCKEFIEKNKGKIWVESIQGKGSTFTFTLPKKVSKIL